jgi:hypothetical protein
VLIVARKERAEAGERVGDLWIDWRIPGEVVIVLGEGGGAGAGMDAGEGVGWRRGQREESVRGVVVWRRREGRRAMVVCPAGHGGGRG